MAARGIGEGEIAPPGGPASCLAWFPRPMLTALWLTVAIACAPLVVAATYLFWDRGPSVAATRSVRAQRGWVRLLKKAYRVRRLQRLFYNVGVRLQDFDAAWLDRSSHCLGEQPLRRGTAIQRRRIGALEYGWFVEGTRTE